MKKRTMNFCDWLCIVHVHCLHRIPLRAWNKVNCVILYNYVSQLLIFEKLWADLTHIYFRPIRESCGGNGHGLCTTNHKSPWSFSSCQCTSGFKGWTCDQIDHDAPHSTKNTLLLTLSNLLFIPAIGIGTIHILRKHLYSTKLNLTKFLIFHRTEFFSSKHKNFFFNITFWQNFHVEETNCSKK